MHSKLSTELCVCVRNIIIADKEGAVCNEEMGEVAAAFSDVCMLVAVYLAGGDEFIVGGKIIPDGEMETFQHYIMRERKFLSFFCSLHYKPVG